MAAKKPRIIVHQGQGSIFFAWGICQFPREQLQLSSRTDAGTVLLPVRRTQKGDWLPSNASAALVSEIHAWVARVLRGNHPCRGGGREGFEMNPRTGRELSVSPRQLLSLRGEIQCVHPSASPSLLPSIMCSEKHSLFAQSQWQFTGCLGAPWESPRAAR